jgi:cytochrome c-type biogenesis protein CcmH
MLTFWIIAVAMMALAVAALMPSLLGRARHNTVSRKALNLAIYKERLAELQLDRIDSAQRDQTRAEIERELLEDLRNDGELPGRPLRGSHAMAAVVALLIPVLSVTVYSQLGSRTALERTAALPAMASAGGLPPDHPPMSGQQAMPSLEEMVARLAERLKSDPDNLEGWMMLGRSYLAMRQPEPATTRTSCPATPRPAPSSRAGPWWDNPRSWSRGCWRSPRNTPTACGSQGSLRSRKETTPGP